MKNLKLTQVEISNIIQQKYLFRGTTDFSWNHHVAHYPYYFNNKDMSTTTSIEIGMSMAYALNRSEENYFGYRPRDRWITGPLLLAINALKYLPFLENSLEPGEITVRKPVDYADIILVADTSKLHAIASTSVDRAAVIRAFLDTGFQPGDKANLTPQCVQITPTFQRPYTHKR